MSFAPFPTSGGEPYGPGDNRYPIIQWVEGLFTGTQPVATVGGTISAAPPAPFPSTGVDFLRETQGLYRTSFNPDSYLASWVVTKTIFVNVKTGNDTTGNGATGTPYKTIAKAMAVAIAAVDTVIQITAQMSGADSVFARDEFIGDLSASTISGKRIAIVPDDARFKILATTEQRALSWSLAAGQSFTYQATRSQVIGVIDVGYIDSFGIPVMFTRVGSIAAVESTAGSWFQSGSTIYVHTLYGTVPVEDHQCVLVNVHSADVTLASASEIFLRNCFVIGSSGVGIFAQNATNDFTANKIVAWNCAIAYANVLPGSATASNGFGVDGLKVSQLYYCASAYNSADGFNFHYTRADPTPGAIRSYYALCFGCVSYDNGIGNSVASGINNAFTAHEGVNIGCIACSGWNTQGPLFAMVNGCNTALIGCVSLLSAASGTGTTHAAYYGDQVAMPAGITGQMYLNDCVGNDTVWDLSTDGSAFPITLLDFFGFKILPAAIPFITVLPNSSRIHNQDGLRGPVV